MLSRKRIEAGSEAALDAVDKGADVARVEVQPAAPPVQLVRVQAACTQVRMGNRMQLLSLTQIKQTNDDD